MDILPQDKMTWSHLKRRLSRSKSLTYTAKTDGVKMPTCVPVSNNNVTDVNANKPPPGNDSKIHRIMACLFWKKKTDVVDMKKDSVAKKQKLTVDRSERSRRVLKMESMKEAPRQREETSTNNQTQSSAVKQMFLPSENPTASFLSYMNPSVRRACSDVIKSSTDNNNKPKSKEAFVQDARTVKTRNTNYRGHRASDRDPIGSNTIGKPPRVPPRSFSQSQPTKKPIVVPGTMVGSDDEAGYNSENDILDLHDEMRRMNLSHPELRSTDVGKRHRRREGSISLSESGGSSDEEVIGCVDINRPPNPAPEDFPKTVRPETREDPVAIKGPASIKDPVSIKDENNHKDPLVEKRKSMEQVIDALFDKAQNNLDTIYQNGLEQLEDIETFRAETATPETCMKRLEEQLREPSDEEGNPNTNGAFVNRKSSAGKNKTSAKGNNKDSKQTNQGNEILEEYVPEMDGLLSEVSTWAKDRQSWILSETQNQPIRREDTSVSFNDRIIDHVTRTNDDKCSEWVENQSKREYRDTPIPPDTSGKMNGILTGPKLFRSTSKTPYSRRAGFIEESPNETTGNTKDKKENEGEKVQSYDHFKTMINSNVNKNGLLVGNSPNVMHLGNLPGFGKQTETKKTDEDNFSLMYCDDRSTIDDNLSDMEQHPNYPSRSPDSWISSVVSYSNRPTGHADNHNDSFEGAVPSRQSNRDKQASPAKRSASSPAKSHQIVRIAPKIYAPFMNIEKPKLNKPLVGESKSFSGLNKPMIRNTQLRPLPASRPPRPIEMIRQMSGLDSVSATSYSGTAERTVYRGSRNMLNDLDSKIPVAEASPRPYSEIPVRATSLNSFDKSQSQHAEPPQFYQRPASETIPVKRMDKIGMGQVMATESNKDRNKYARDIVNSFNKPRYEPQNAFDESKEGKLNEANSDNKETKHKRHKVFNNSLLKGGYTYDKHSRTASRQSSRKYSDSDQTGRDQTATSAILTDASVSQLHLSVADSTNTTNLLGNGQVKTHNPIPGDPIKDAPAITSGKLVQSHTHGVGYNEPSNSEDINKTADRFKRLRSRRDQEIEWLMKDAAETEV